MSTTLLCRELRWVYGVTLIFASSYCLFAWDWRVYEFFAKPSPCYSENKKFYVVRYITPWKSIFPNYLNLRGTAKLYRDDGSLVHEWPAYFGPDSGPYWHDDDQEDMRAVIYFTGDDSEVVHIPEPVGAGVVEKLCY